MITPSTAFQAANAALAKKPIFLIEIAGYTRAFATQAGLGTFMGLSQEFWLQYAMGSATFPQTSASATLAKATPAGNILFAFCRNAFNAPTIVDMAGNTWHQIYSLNPDVNGAGTTIWYATSVAAAAGNRITTSSSNLDNMALTVIEVPSQYSGFVYGGATGTVNFAGGSPASLPTQPSVTTSDGVTYTFPMAHTGGGSSQWQLFVISLAPPSGVKAAVGLAMLAAHSPTQLQPADPSHVINENSNFAFGYPFWLVAGAPCTSYDWLTSEGIDDLKETVSDLEGSSDLSDLTFTIQDRGRQLTADLSTFTFEGKKARLLMGFAGNVVPLSGGSPVAMAVLEYLTLFSGQIDTVDSVNGNLDYTFTAYSVNLKKLSQKIYLTGDDGFAISSNHPKTLFDHPLNILVDALDQAGIVAPDIDIAKIQYYRDKIFAGTPFEFTLTSAPTAKEFIEGELMKPLSMYLRVNNVGVVTINSFYPAVSGSTTYTPPTPPVMTAVVSTNPSDVNQFDVPLAQEAPLVNQVVFKFDYSDTNSDALAEEIVDLDASISKYGLVGSKTIEAQGMKSGFQGYFQAALSGRLICLRYGFKNLVFDSLPLTWNSCVLEPGDIIAVTNPFVPDRIAGVLGISNMFFEVLDRNWRFLEGVVEVKLLAIDFSRFKQFKITPNAEASYAAASSGDKAIYMFQCGADGKYSTGAAANTLG
jgi:hypothetical protein